MKISGAGGRLIDAAIIIFLIGVIWKASSWKTAIEKDMENLTKNIENIQRHVEGIKSPGPEETKKDQINKDETGSSSSCLGIIGFINEELAQEALSSYGASYLLDYNICEINEAFGMWNEIGLIPYLGHFIEVENTCNGLKTWCMVIGSFEDNDHPKRALLVSREVATRIVFKQRKGILPVRIRLLNEAEWKSNKDCLNLYESVYKLKRL